LVRCCSVWPDQFNARRVRLGRDGGGRLGSLGLVRIVDFVALDVVQDTAGDKQIEGVRTISIWGQRFLLVVVVVAVRLHDLHRLVCDVHGQQQRVPRYHLDREAHKQGRVQHQRYSQGQHLTTKGPRLFRVLSTRSHVGADDLRRLLRVQDGRDRQRPVGHCFFFN